MPQMVRASGSVSASPDEYAKGAPAISRTGRQRRADRLGILCALSNEAAVTVRESGMRSRVEGGGVRVNLQTVIMMALGRRIVVPRAS